jgi:hypothetical protein
MPADTSFRAKTDMPYNTSTNTLAGMSGLSGNNSLSSLPMPNLSGQANGLVGKSTLFLVMKLQG